MAPASRRCFDGRLGGRPLRAFTLIELLIVITVIGILIAVIGLVGVKVVHQQKVTLTETTMRTVKLAIDQFKEVNPLANIYDRKDAATFGPYPPYQLAGAISGHVREAVEAADPVRPAPLSERLRRDLNVQFGAVTLDEGDSKNNDIRALYTYLRVFVPDALAQVPKSALKQLTATPEFVNPSNNLGGVGVIGAIDVLGIYDAWGVPMDYFLYVKLEYTLLSSGVGWRVAERIPALRSHGISRDEYDAGVVEDPQVWIFSDPFPSPAAAAVDKTNGALVPPFTPQRAGWARAVAGWGAAPNQREDYGYVP